MRISLAVDGPLDAAQTLARYRLWGDDPANRVGQGVFRRVLRLDGRLLPYEVRWSGPADCARLVATVSGSRDRGVSEAVRCEVRHIFGLDFDLAGFYRAAKADAVLAGLVDTLHGLRPTLAPTALEMLVGAITAQQVNLAFAAALRARLVRRWGTPVETPGGVVYAFPDPATLAAAPVDELRAMQFSERKAEYVRTAAAAVADGTVHLERLAAATNEAVVACLTGLRGLGLWTAEWFLARCLGRGDVCPAGDLGVRKAFAHFYGKRGAESEEAIRKRAGRWGPYQNLAIHYLLAGMRLARQPTGGAA